MEEKELSPKERERYDVIRACIDGDLTNAEAAARLRLHVRQVRRLKRRVESESEQGVVHGNIETQRAGFEVKSLRAKVLCYPFFDARAIRER